MSEQPPAPPSTQAQPDVVIDVSDEPVQTDNSGEFDEVLPQDPNWRPDDATDVAP